MVLSGAITGGVLSTQQVESAGPAPKGNLRLFLIQIDPNTGRNLEGMYMHGVVALVSARELTWAGWNGVWFSMTVEEWFHNSWFLVFLVVKLGWWCLPPLYYHPWEKTYSLPNCTLKSIVSGRNSVGQNKPMIFFTQSIYKTHSHPQRSTHPSLSEKYLGMGTVGPLQLWLQPLPPFCEVLEGNAAKSH